MKSYGAELPYAGKGEPRIFVIRKYKAYTTAKKPQDNRAWRVLGGDISYAAMDASCLKFAPDAQAGYNKQSSRSPACPCSLLAGL